jgi:hypothetical protein
MTWTYNPALTTNKDKVRFLVRDVDSAKPLLQDEEILGILEMESAARRAAATCAESLAAHFGQLATTLVDDLGVTVTYADRAAFFTGLAMKLRNRANIAVAPTAGGITISSKQVQADNTDRVQPAFRRELHDALGTQPIAEDYERRGL